MRSEEIIDRAGTKMCEVAATRLRTMMLVTASELQLASGNLSLLFLFCNIFLRFMLMNFPWTKESKDYINFIIVFFFSLFL